MSCGVGRRRGLDLALWLLWCKLAAVAPIQPLACKPPCHRCSPKKVNGMEWNGMEWNGMEWNGIETKRNETKRNWGMRGGAGKINFRKEATWI